MLAFSKLRLVVAAALLFSTIVCVSAVAAESGPITVERAREIALAQTGGGEVMELDKHYRGNGIHFYRLEIVSDDGAYHVEIDASNGKLLQFIRKHGYNKHGYKRNRQAVADAAISFEQALAAALERTGGGTVVESETDVKRDGRIIYEFEIVNNGVKFELDIDGSSGEIVKFKQKGRPLYPIPTPAPGAEAPVVQSSVQTVGLPQPRLDAAAAQAIAREKIGGGTVTEYKLDLDDGQLVHEMKLVNGNTRYEVEIEDASGAILEFSAD